MRLKRTYKYFFALASFGFTAFVFMNTYEVVWNKDIAVAQSVQKVAAHQAVDAAVKDFAVKASAADHATDLGGISYIEIPALKARLKVEEARKINGQWYQRPSVAHYIGLNKDDTGTTVDYLLYAGKSWRSMPSPERIGEGMEVRVEDTNGASSIFAVTEKKQLPLDRSLIVSKVEGRQVLLMIEDPRAGMYYGYSLVLKK